MASSFLAKARIGIAGLDDILNGGFAKGRLFLLEGLPGTGKSTLALQFLLEGAKTGEKGLYITLSDGAGAARWRRLARVEHRRWHRGIRAGAPGKSARRGPAAKFALFIRPRTRRDDEENLRSGGSRKAYA